MATLWAVSDLHVGHRGNGDILDRVVPTDPDDWLIVAGDVCERTDDLESALRVLRDRFHTVIWVPGNHELYTTVKDPLQIFGVHRYDYLVSMAREIGVVTPEDQYPLFRPTPDSEGVRIVPMFLLYDYTYRQPEFANSLEALADARSKNIVATDEFILSSEPFATRDAWCRERVEITKKRLDALDPNERTVLINHWPLRREPTWFLRHREFALWCGTTATETWHTDYNALCCVYGHLHIPRTTWYDGIRFEEVSVGYPREWQTRGLPEPLLRKIIPDDHLTADEVPEAGIRFHIPEDRRDELRAWAAAADKAAETS